MSGAFEFNDPLFDVPASALEADPEAQIRELLYRVSQLEATLAEERMQNEQDIKELLLTHIAVADDVRALLERVGVPTTASEAFLSRNLSALGSKAAAILKRFGVEPIHLTGQPADPDLCDVVGERVSDFPAGMVLREDMAGYRWRRGVLRKGHVTVSRGRDG